MNLPIISTAEFMALISILNSTQKSINVLPNLRAGVDNSGYVPQLWVRAK